MRYVLGIDPGPIVGVCLIRLPGEMRDWHAEAAQITPGGLWGLIAGWQEAYTIVGVAAETFVIGRLSTRVNDPEASKAARDVLGGLRLAIPSSTHAAARTAAMVKPWATDRRLDAAGLLDITKGMRHARDAARHALFSACRDFHARDPLAADAEPLGPATAAYVAAGGA